MLRNPVTEMCALLVRAGIRKRDGNTVPPAVVLRGLSN